MKKYMQIVMFSLTMIIQILFFGMLLATYIPLPRFFSIIAIPHFVLAIIIWVIPNITLLVMEYIGMTKQIMVQSVLGLCLLVVVTCVQVVIVPTLFGEAIASYTNNIDDYGEYDLVVQSEYDSIAYFPTNTSDLLSVDYVYKYLPEFKIWGIYAEFQWENTEMYEKEIDRLDQFASKNCDNWQVCYPQSAHPVTVAYATEYDEKKICYFMCDGVETFLTRLKFIGKV
mgnify:FL=1